MHFPAAPVEAWPQVTFIDKLRLFFNNEELGLSYVPPHTRTRIS